MKLILTKTFFFTDDVRDYYDFTKIQFYNILYCGGDDEDKCKFIY